MTNNVRALGMEEAPFHSLPQECLNLNISALSYTTKSFLSNILNSVLTQTDDDLPRNWQGLYEKVELDYYIEPNLRKNPTGKLIDMWLDLKPSTATVANLLTYLEQMEHFDLIESLEPMIVRDYQNHLATETEMDDKAPFDILTRDDVIRSRNGEGPQFYTAFIIFAYEDQPFVEDLIIKLEQEYDLKLCVKDRDLLASLERETILKLIAERCDKLIAVISPAFLQIKANQFFCNFALKLGMDHQQSKFMPILYRTCTDMPRELTMFHMLNYERYLEIGLDFWSKLVACVSPNSASIARRNIVTNGCATNVTRVSSPKLESLKRIKPVKWLNKKLTRKRADAVIETPVIKIPVSETPVIETSVVETPVIETSVIQTVVKVDAPVANQEESEKKKKRAFWKKKVAKKVALVAS